MPVRASSVADDREADRVCQRLRWVRRIECPTSLASTAAILDTRHMSAAHSDQRDTTALVDIKALRDQVRLKYAAVAVAPDREYHFHTGRTAAERCRYDMSAVDRLPSVAVESFAGVANPFELRALDTGEKVVDLGSGAGFDTFLASEAVGIEGFVVGIDMTDEMLTKARATATTIGVSNVEFRAGYLEEVPVDDGWADVVISNGVINLCPDKAVAFTEAWRVLRPGGVLQFADIANGRPVPEEAMREIDLWTG
jgi:arsenite methyltransferase